MYWKKRVSLALLIAGAVGAGDFHAAFANSENSAVVVSASSFTHDSIRRKDMKQMINTPHAPAAIGTYSQAIKSGSMVYLSGQIPLTPGTMEIVKGDFKARVRRVIENVKAIAEEAGGNLNQVVKLTIYLTDMKNFSQVNEVMQEYFTQPYPARAVIAVAALPKEVDIEIDAIVILPE